MSESTNNQKYPVSTSEVAGMLGFHSTEDLRALPTVEIAGSGSAAPANLPIDAGQHQDEEHKGNTAENHQAQAKQIPALKALRNIMPYLAIFTLGIFLYFFFFTRVDFASIFKTQAKVQTPQQSALQQLEKQSLAGYNKWIAQFYYHVSDSKVLDPEADNSGNGLSNFQKYLLNLNPKSYDTLGLGMADSEALAKGISPLTGNALTDQQKQIMDKYFDMEVVMNRLALAQMQKQTQVAGARTPAISQSFGANQFASPTSANLDINQSIPARLEIPDLKINVPIIWTQDQKNFDTDLRSGVVHYPGTAMPGQIGTSYISGHSSNYVWAKGNYNHIFSKLDSLAKNASFKVTVMQKNGKNAVLYYVVTGSQQYEPKDQAQFQNSSQSVMALSTCWPVGSTAKRMVVFGQLTQVQAQ